MQCKSIPVAPPGIRNATRWVLALAGVFLLAGCGAPTSEARYRALSERYEAEPPPSEPPPERRLALADTLERDSLVRAVLDRNPGLAAARQAVRAMLARYPQQGSLADPVLSYSLAPLSIGSEAPPFGQRIELRQSFPFFGKLDHRREIALAEAAAAAGDVETLRLELATRASVSFDDGYYLQRAIAITQRHIDLLEEFHRVSIARYESGMSGQEEPLLAEVELAHAEHRLADLKTDLLIVLAGINTLLHRDLDAPLPPFPAGLDVPAAGFADLGALRESALAARPELRRLDAQAEARAAGVALAESEYRPDFGLMGSYDTMWRETEHQWMVGLSVNLPLRRERRNAAKREAESRVSEIDAMRAETRDAVLFEVDRAYRKLHKSRHVIGLFTNRLLPASEDHLSAARSSLETGRTTFLDLIDAERNLRTTELGYEEALTDYYRARAALERATGRIPGLSGEEQ